MSSEKVYAAIVFSHLNQGERMVTHFATTSIVVEGDQHIELGPVHNGPQQTYLFSEQLRSAVAFLETLAETGMPHKITLFLDSEWLYKGLTQWIYQWRKSGWIARTSGKPVMNRELWEKLDALVGQRVDTLLPMTDLKYQRGEPVERLFTLVEAARTQLKGGNAVAQIKEIASAVEVTLPDPVPVAAPALLPGQGIW